MRRRKKRTKKQLKASRDESYGKFGSKKRKPRGGGKINVWLWTIFVKIVFLYLPVYWEVLDMIYDEWDFLGLRCAIYIYMAVPLFYLTTKGYR